MQRYSWAALARHALGQHRGWTPLWRKAAPRSRYSVVIIGGGGHGLATAYYLAKEHGIGDVAVLEKGAIAWGYARAADARGVDIIENCEVTAIRTANGHVTGVETSRGDIAADKIAIVAAGHNSVLAAMAGVRLPLQSHPLQALVSEPVKPVLDCVVMSNTVHVYVSQSDKGELVIGAGIDAFNSYAQRGSFPIIEGQMAALLEL